MNHRTEAETFTLRAGREYAAACGQTMVSAFEDTLSGDLARLQMRRRLRSAFAGISSAIVDRLIEELLTP